MKLLKTTSVFIAACVLLASCKDKPEQKAAETTTAAPVQRINTPNFNADSTYADINAQVALGPRTPGSAAQKKCADWMQAKLKKVCDTVYRQETQVKGGDGKSLPCYNLIGSINPKAQRRILFLTHWDSRPWADQDTKDQDKPILAADDAASGVAMLLEVAKQVKGMGLAPDLGIDILFTDVEDYGKSQWGENSYCLGTQYWAKNPHVPGYKAEFGILLDMVGARNAQFPLEGFSAEYASAEQQMVWQAAGHAGFSSYFPYIQAGKITDDHVPVNEIIHIKTIDIINLDVNSPKVFAPHWHTHADNMDIIDKGTLKAVGQTLLQVIYENAAKA